MSGPLCGPSSRRVGPHSGPYKVATMLTNDELAIVNDPDQDPAWAVWAAWKQWPSWWYRRGLPPTLQHPRADVRLIRMLTLMFLLGSLSTAACQVWMWCEKLLDSSGISWPYKGIGLMFLPGIWFGLFVLIPLSRWQGRSWWVAVPAVGVSAGIYWGAVVSFVQFAPIMSSASDKSWWLAGLSAGTVGGLGLWCWMNPPWYRRSWYVLGPTWFAAVLGSLIFAILFDNEPNTPLMPGFVSLLLSIAAMFGPFHIGVAMALGLTLLWTPIGVGQAVPDASRSSIGKASDTP